MRLESLAVVSSRPYVYIVGGQGFVAREIRRRLQAGGAQVAGHAPADWDPPFAPPRYTTHILVVEDDVNQPLKVHAERLARDLHIPIIKGPARNHWATEVEPALVKEGVLAANGKVEPEAPAPAPTSGGATIGERMAAKAAENPTPPPRPVPVPPPPPEPPPAAVAPVPPPEAAPLSSDPNVAVRQLIEKLLRQSEGALGYDTIAEIVVRQLGVKLPRGSGLDLIEKIRKQAGLPPSHRGTKSAALRALLAEYDIASKPPAFSKRWDRQSTKETTTPRHDAPEEKKTLSDKPLPAVPSDDDLQAAIDAVAGVLEEQVLRPFGITRLTLRYENGHWGEPEIERITISRPKLRIGGSKRDGGSSH